MARLAPDMLPLTKQVQIATDFAKGNGRAACRGRAACVRGQRNELRCADRRIDRTIAYVQTLKPAQIDGSEDRRITRPIRGEPKTFTGLSYLLSFALPNFYFHVTTTYALLRQNGLDIGKNDFIGALEFV